MDDFNFVDLATKAKELGISEGTLRARILSGTLPCFAYMANVKACASRGEWLPAFDAGRFPMVEWIDHGSAFREYELDPRSGWPPNRTPCYHINGWVVLDRLVVEAVLTRSKCDLDGAPIHVMDSKLTVECCLHVYVAPEKEWVVANVDAYPDGGYWNELPAKLTLGDLFVLAAEPCAHKTLSSRKEQSYLGIIAAMRALLRDKSGGCFPSDAKIIEQLVDRHKPVDGISKRNLESVFADATRTVGDLVTPK